MVSGCVGPTTTGDGIHSHSLLVIYATIPLDMYTYIGMYTCIIIIILSWILLSLLFLFIYLHSNMILYPITNTLLLPSPSSEAHEGPSEFGQQAAQHRQLRTVVMEKLYVRTMGWNIYPKKPMISTYGGYIQHSSDGNLFMIFMFNAENDEQLSISCHDLPSISFPVVFPSFSVSHRVGQLAVGLQPCGQLGLRRCATGLPMGFKGLILLDHALSPH